MDDLQTASQEMGFVVVHGFQVNVHSLLDGLDKLARLLNGKVRPLEPVRERKGTARFQKPYSVGEEAPMIVIVRDGLDGPKKVKRPGEIQGFGVHQKEVCVQLRSNGRLSGHFHLHWGDGDARRACLVLLRQVKAGTPEAATDVEDR